VFYLGKIDEPVEMPEVVFYGLTLIITNLTVLGNIDLEERTEIMSLSIITIVLLTFFLGFSLLYTNEHERELYSSYALHIPPLMLWSVICSTIWAMCYSYYVNEIVFAYNEKASKYVKRKSKGVKK
jgi:fumarate reductase subunit D